MGRPRIYDNAEDIDAAIDEYFSGLNNGDMPKPPTMAGLAYALGFESRQSLYAYEKDGRFSYSIKRAKLAIEIWYEERMSGNSPTGAIFWLKNHAGYTDKQEISGNDDKPFSLKIEYVSKKE